MRFREKKRCRFEGEGEVERPPQVVGLRDRIAHFTWYVFPSNDIPYHAMPRKQKTTTMIGSYLVHKYLTISTLRPWFSTTMSTASLSTILSQTPNTFRGLHTIGTIFFIFNLFLFLTFNILMATRFILIPRKLLASLHHPVEGLFHGTYWVSVALILNGTYIYGEEKTGGAWLTQALEVCFWMYSGVAFAVGVAQYSMFFRLERLSVTDAVPAWIFPIYPLLIVGTLAGTILPGQGEKASWRMFVGGVLLQGLAWVVSFLMYGIYMQRLMTSKLPSASVRPGMYVSVGPAGESFSLPSPFSLLTPHLHPVPCHPMP